MQKKMQNIAIQVLKFALAGGILWWLIQSDFLNFAQLSLLMSPEPLLLLTLMCLLCFFLTSERWRTILKRQGFQMSSMQTFRFTLIGNFFNVAMPGGVGGDVVKAYYIARNHPEQKLRSILTIAIDRLLGLFSMLVMALAVMLWNWNELQQHNEFKTILLFFSILFAGFMTFWCFTFSRRLYEKGWIQNILKRLPKSEHFIAIYETFAAYRDHKSSFFQSVGLSFLAQTTSILFFIIAGRYMGFNEIPIETFFFIVPIGFMVMALPISPAGIGVGQAAFFFLFNVVLKESSQVGPSTITAWQLMGFAFGLVGAVLYIFMPGRKAKITADTPG